MTSGEIRQKFLKFFEVRGHAIIPSASLVPENDPTTLFTGSGMQPLIPYLLGQPHPLGKRLVNSQKSFRAEDIEEVGDNRHTTFFEMLGNWSLGDYWKEEQLSWFFEFLTKEVGIKKEKLAVTCFEGDPSLNLPRDDESAEIWKKLGVPEERIYFYSAKKNWWSRSGVPANMPAGEPGGPDSEVFFEFESVAHDKKYGDVCHPNCDCGRFMEIGNSVFMEYKKNEDGTFGKLKQRNVDFGGGLERITAAANNDPDVFRIDIFQSVIEKIEEYSPSVYQNAQRSFRIIADHIRAVAFLISDGVLPNNTGREYVLRKLIRRSIRYADLVGIEEEKLSLIGASIGNLYGDIYSVLLKSRKVIEYEINKEEGKFRFGLKNGLRKLQSLEAVQKRLKDLTENKEQDSKFAVKWRPDFGSRSADFSNLISGKDAFDLYQNYGFPPELINEELAQYGMGYHKEEFEAEMKKHQDLSRTSSAGTFKGGLADSSEKTTRLHTAHHLLLKSLQIILGPGVKQRGSNITQERLRLDFSYEGKMTESQKKEVERIVNEKIAEDLPIIRSEMALEDAEKLHAEHEFGAKYPTRVSVYSVGPKGATLENPQFDKAFSIEFCGGPHVTHTGVIGKFTIKKEEAVAAGIRRIRGIVE